MKNYLNVKIIVVSFILCCMSINLSAQTENHEANEKRFFIGTSFFSLFNLLPEPPSFYQLDLGYWLTDKDAIIIEAITWKYGHPLGIPYGPSFDAPEEAYPGYIRGYGVGVDYQRLIWKGIYTTIHATPFLQQHYDSDENKIQNGFQLFLQLRLGYHLEFFNHRIYLEPSVSFNYWPVNTNVPESFANLESNWPSYFLFEPGLNFGYKF